MPVLLAMVKGSKLLVLLLKVKQMGKIRKGVEGIIKAVVLA